jgi:hypothetical protein
MGRPDLGSVAHRGVGHKILAVFRSELIVSTAPAIPVRLALSQHCRPRCTDVSSLVQPHEV